MKIAITGVTGFLGSALARQLILDGHEVVGIARATSQIERLSDLPISWMLADVTIEDSLRTAFDGVDWLIHSAGMLGQAGVPETEYFRLHEGGTRNVLEEAEKANVKRILHISSPGVLGPITGPLADETAVLAPGNPYEKSKAAGEKVALEFAERGLPIIIARPEFVYGPEDTHVLGLFQAVKNGRFFYINGGKHYCHPTFINDAVIGILKALMNGKLGSIYHITGPNPVTFKELGETIAQALCVPVPKISLPKLVVWPAAFGLELISKLFNRQPPLSRTGVAFFSEDRRFSWEKAKNELSYEPEYSLKKGVAVTVSWYQANGFL